MKSEIIVAMLALLGTLSGTFGGIMTSNKLTNYRIQQLEQRVDKHNNLIERTFQLEGRVAENSHDILEIKSALTAERKAVKD